MSARVFYVRPCGIDGCTRLHGIGLVPTSRPASVESVPGGIERSHTEAARGADTRPSRVPPLPTTGNRERRGEPPVVPVPRERIGTLAGPARHDRGTGSSSRSGSRAGHRRARPFGAGQRGSLTTPTDGGSRPA